MLVCMFLPLSHVAWTLRAAFAEVLYHLSSCEGICAHDKIFCFVLSGKDEVTLGSCLLFILTLGI